MTRKGFSGLLLGIGGCVDDIVHNIWANFNRPLAYYHFGKLSIVDDHAIYSLFDCYEKIQSYIYFFASQVKEKTKAFKGEVI
mmetsp:Transcript_48870/g.49223  ORF Transcript_48870/g.49223 Transcript_48870/m.49223 type:complete len:82 (+) Transcript_48870:192-437(+)